MQHSSDRNFTSRDASQRGKRVLDAGNCYRAAASLRRTNGTNRVGGLRALGGTQGWLVTRDFTDEGVSGAALGNRPGLASALSVLTRRDVLLVADLTRLSRSQDLAPLLERLRYQGTRVAGVLDGFDLTSPQARMQAGLSGLMSDEYRASIRARTHSALEMRAREGRPTPTAVRGVRGRQGAFTVVSVPLVIGKHEAVGGELRVNVIARDLSP